MPSISQILHRAMRNGARRRPRLRLDLTSTAIYAIGDVHGCLDELLELERRIAADASPLPGRKLIVMLGDYVDRGPASAGVVEHLCGEAPEDFERICLLGNHEVALLEYLDGNLDYGGWLGLGAQTTLASYGLDSIKLSSLGPGAGRALVENALPAAHVEFLRSLPILIETDKFVFVHAGLNPAFGIDDQSDHDLVWTRPTNENRQLSKWVVHGHTPVERPQRNGRRINLDTGCFYSGRLSALRIWDGKARLLSNKG